MSMERIVFFILASIYLSCLHAAPIDTDTKKIELQQVSNQIKLVQTNLSQTHQLQTNAQEQLKTAETTLQNLNQDISHINQLQKMQLLKLTQLKNQLMHTQTILSKQQEALEKEINTAYRLGKLDEFKILLNQENADSLIRHLGYYRYLTQHRLELIIGIKQTLLALTQTKQAISAQQDSLNTLLQQKNAQQAKQLALRTLRQQLITKLNQDMQTKEAELTTLLANQKALQDMLNSLQSQSINILNNQAFTNLRGKLDWPVKGTITSAFGSNLDVGDQHLSGVIIKAPLGTPVHAISAGKVVFADWLRGFGLLVIINHGNGYMSLYARNQSLRVKVGDDVKPTDIIATTGNTGGYEVSSLYFEIRQNGIPKNPSLWCRYT